MASERRRRWLIEVIWASEALVRISKSKNSLLLILPWLWRHSVAETRILVPLIVVESVWIRIVVPLASAPVVLAWIVRVRIIVPH